MVHEPPPELYTLSRILVKSHLFPFFRSTDHGYDAIVCAANVAPSKVGERGEPESEGNREGRGGPCGEDIEQSRRRLVQGRRR